MSRTLLKGCSRWVVGAIHRLRPRPNRYYVVFAGSPSGSISYIVPVATRATGREAVLRSAMEQGLLEVAELKLVQEVTEVSLKGYLGFASRDRRFASA